MGSYYLRAWHMRWFNDHLDDGVHLRDLGEDISDAVDWVQPVRAEIGRKVIEKLTEGPIGDLPFMGCGSLRYRPDPRQGWPPVRHGRAGL